MVRILAVMLGVVVLAGLGLGVYVYDQVTTLELEAITDDVHLIRGIGGNVAVLRTGEGAVVVDTKLLRLQGERIRAKAEELGGGPVQLVINTHYHADHTHGNPGFSPGTRILATERTREHLLARDTDYWEGESRTFLPNHTFEDREELRIGGKTIRVVHLGPGHTDGDLVVLFVEDRVIHMGDLFFYKRYPVVDLEAGGGIERWGDTIEKAFELDWVHAIPGHGSPSDREGLRGFQRFIRQLWQIAESARKSGASLEETLASEELTEDVGYTPLVIPFLVQRDRAYVLRRAWEEGTGAVRPDSR